MLWWVYLIFKQLFINFFSIESKQDLGPKIMLNLEIDS